MSTKICRLRPVIFFPTVEASVAPNLGRLDGLAVHDASARRRLPSRLLAHALPQGPIDPCQRPVPRPDVEVVAYRPPVAELPRHHPPLAAAPLHVTQRIDHSPQLHRPRPTRPTHRLHQQRLQYRPLRICHIRRIAPTHLHICHHQSSPRVPRRFTRTHSSHGTLTSTFLNMLSGRVTGNHYSVVSKLYLRMPGRWGIGRVTITRSPT